MSNLKKLSFAALGIVLIAAIYYYTAGATQLTRQVKVQVDSQLASLKTQGFSVKDRNVSEHKEHFIISFDDPEKIAIYLRKHGTQISVEDAKVLKGLKIGVDINYLPSAYSAVSFDLYPLVLPNIITSSATTAEDKKIITQIDKMLDEKTFLLHVTINKLGTGFKGYIKDIDEVLETHTSIKFLLSKFEFYGDIKDNSIQNMQQALKSIHLDVKDTFKLTFDGLKSNYESTGDTSYDYKTEYSIESIRMQENTGMKLEIKNFEALSVSSVRNSLLSTTLKTKTKSINIDEKNDKIVLDTIILNLKADKLNTLALEALGKVDPNNEKEINDALQKLISEGMYLEISEFSVANIEAMGEKMEGFNLNLLLDVDKSLNITAMQQNPLHALNALNANLTLSLSKELYTLIEQQPQAVMAMMLFQPKELNGKKVYKLELKDGKLTVNGSPVL